MSGSPHSPRLRAVKPPALDAEASLWGDLVDATDPAAVARAWLGLQCHTIASVHRGTVWSRPPGAEELVLVASWPDGSSPHPALEDAARAAVDAGQGLVRRVDGEEIQTALAYPLLLGGTPGGVVALASSEQEAAPLTTIMRQVQWGAARLREALGLVGSDVDRATLERTRCVLDIAAAVAEADGITAACHTAASELSLHCGCERVTVGFLKGGNARVMAISLSAEFGKRMNIVRELEAAMDEAIEQRAIAIYPPPRDAEPLTLQAHQGFSRAHGGCQLLTVPLLAHGDPVGALVCERTANRPFEQATVDVVCAVAALLGPTLDEKRRNDRSLLAKTGEVLWDHAERIIGPEHTAAKLVALAVTLVLGFAVFAVGRDRVTADARIEGRVQRSIVAPFDGYVREAPVRAGDVVAKGDLLAAMDDRDLVIERLKWSTEQSNKEHEYERALSDRDRAEATVVQTLIESARAQIRLIDELLARSRIVSPFDGIVVAGDLSQAIGAAVGRGDTFFEIAPLNEYRVVLLVDEGRVADVETGARGELLLAALPNEPLDFVVDQITPVATVEDGNNVFRVEAKLAKESERLRPGMEGVAKVDVGRAHLISIWLRPAVEWARMHFWRWLP
jgi:multidrug resistance efflux pump